MGSNTQFVKDIAILAVIILAIYYLKYQTGDGFNPFDEVASFVKFGG